MTSYLEPEASYLDPPRPMRLRNGEDRRCEDEAAAWLAKSREGVTALRDMRDFLTKDQLTLRGQKEVLNSHGVADQSLYPGLFRRAYNPLTHQRPRGLRNSEED